MKQIGRYKILHRLGAGGMGVVYRAVACGADGFQKPVALKRIHQHLSKNQGSLQHFISEAKILMRLAHGNVVQVLDLCKLEDEYFIVFEYVDGENLESLLKRCAEADLWLKQNVVLYITTEILRGLNYIHCQRAESGEPLGIVHRDIKPSNILCSVEGEIKIADFGIARVRGWNKNTQLGSLKGTIRYMSPEQARGESIDQQSDIFSVGILLYFMICQVHPYDHPSIDQTIDKVKSATFRTPSARGIRIPSALENIILTAMQPLKSDRFKTAAAMLEALEKYQRTIHYATASDLQKFFHTLRSSETRGINTAPGFQDTSNRWNTTQEQIIGADVQLHDTQKSTNEVSILSLGQNITATLEHPEGILPSFPEEMTLSQGTFDLQRKSEAPKSRESTSPIRSPGKRFFRFTSVVIILALVLVGAVFSAKFIFRSSSKKNKNASEASNLTSPPPRSKNAPPSAPVNPSSSVKRLKIAPPSDSSSPPPSNSRMKDTQPSTPSIPPIAPSLEGEITNKGHRLKSETSSPKVPHLALELQKLTNNKHARAHQIPRRNIKNNPLSLNSRAPFAAQKPHHEIKGWIRISTQPYYAKVYWHGKYLDTTPCRIQLPVGEQRLVLVNPQANLKVQRTIDVHAEKETVLEIKDFSDAT